MEGRTGRRRARGGADWRTGGRRLHGGATTTGAREAACGWPAAGGILARAAAGSVRAAATGAGGGDRCWGGGGRTTAGRRWRPGPRVAGGSRSQDLPLSGEGPMPPGLKDKA
jgi:hypothetical protein